MKYKKLTKEQIIISLDRLTRFKSTKEKYLRVFSDIITGNLIEPKLKKSDIMKTDFSELTSIATEIFNNSVSPDKDKTYLINNIVKEFENNTYTNDTETQKFLNNNLNYKEAIKLIPEECSYNLKWLKHIPEYKEQDKKYLREKYNLKYPIEKVLIVEGITEEILLPAFSAYKSFDFYKEGIQIVAAGGKNQVVKTYYKYINEIKLPIYILLDKDAEDNIKQIKPKLRKFDKIHLVSCGEFEDLLPKSLIIKTVNRHFENFLSISDSDLISDLPKAKVLENLFKTKGLHEFKKAEFAKLVKENINQDSDFSDEINRIIKEITD